ncbi:hypothetical protein [Kitasatospora sp. NPDC054795]
MDPRPLQSVSEDRTLLLEVDVLGGVGKVQPVEAGRQAGPRTRRPTAVVELWPLVGRLEARTEDCHADLDTLRLLARARPGHGGRWCRRGRAMC